MSGRARFDVLALCRFLKDIRIVHFLGAIKVSVCNVLQRMLCSSVWYALTVGTYYFAFQALASHFQHDEGRAEFSKRERPLGRARSGVVAGVRVRCSSAFIVGI